MALGEGFGAGEAAGTGAAALGHGRDHQLLPGLDRVLGIDPAGGGDCRPRHALIQRDAKAGLTLFHGVVAAAGNHQFLPGAQGIGFLQAVRLGNQHAGHLGAVGDPAQRLAVLDDVDALALRIGFGSRQQQDTGGEQEHRPPAHQAKRPASAASEASWVSSSWSGVTDTYPS